MISIVYDGEENRPQMLYKVSLPSTTAKAMWIIHKIEQTKTSQAVALFPVNTLAF